MSNYEKVYQHFQKLFLETDHAQAAKKLLLQIDDAFIYVPFFQRMFTINRKTAELTCPVYTDEIPFTERLLVLHHLYYYKPDALNCDKFVSFREIPQCAHYEPAYRKNTLEPFALHFAGKADLLKQAGSELGGAAIAYGDVGFMLNAFPLIPLQFIFRDGDDEYPSTANILFDKNIAQFIHPESIPAIADIGAKLLMGTDVFMRKCSQSG